MDTKAQRRLKILTAVLSGRLTAQEAAKSLGMTTRHIRRMTKRLEKEGAKALVHGNRGRPPSNRISASQKTQILGLIDKEYSGFNDVHLQEALERDHGIRIGRETLRSWLRGLGRRAKRKRRAPKHRSRRPRRPCRGMMVQWDGSHHQWLGPDGPDWVLMAAVDDATSDLVGARFMPSESGAAYLLLLDSILEKHGLPESLYQDKHGALSRNDGYWNLEEELEGEQEPTQLGCVLRDLGIAPIFAGSAQGKGRIERFFGTAQDRLVAELRRSKVSTMEEANQFLEEYWIDAYNERFAKEAADAENVYCLITPAQRRAVLAFRYQRTVASDNTVSLGDVSIQIPPGPKRRSYAKARVDILQHVDGTWSVLYQERCIATHEATPLNMPERVRLKRQGRRYARRVSETVQVYWKPDHQALSDEAGVSR